jgi:hypothetical protein
MKQGDTCAGLAQLVEQRFCKPKVAGSIPALGTIYVAPVRPGLIGRRRSVETYRL